MKFLLIPLFFILALVPILIKDVYVIHIMNMIGIYLLLTTGLNLILGYSGQISVGHAAFYGVGAYTSALLTVKAGLNFWLALPASGIMAGLVGVIIAPVLRLKGHVLAMATIAFGEVVRLVLLHWVSLTNGPRGIHRIPYPKLFYFELSSDHRLYYLIMACVALNLFVLFRLSNSRIGRIWRAIKDDQEAAEALGVVAGRYKMMAFVVGGFWAGIAGSLFAHMTTYISPHTFTLHESVKLLTMIIVGGEGSILGSIMGASVLTIASEYFRFTREYSLMPYGVLLLLILIFAPKGLYGLVSQVLGPFKRVLVGA